MIWTPISDKALARQMAAIFIEADAPYSMTAMKNAVDTMKLSLPPMGATERNLIGFSNGVFDTRKGVFRPHQREDWLLVASEVEFGKVTQGRHLNPMRLTSGAGCSMLPQEMTEKRHDCLPRFIW